MREAYDAIAAIVDVFLQRMWDDPVVGRFFVGMGTDTRNKLRQKNKNLLCYNTGGPCQKINRPLDMTHKGLGITDQEFDIVVNHLAPRRQAAHPLSASSSLYFPISLRSCSLGITPASES
jgi:truncated hemoglobin YjbI